MTPLYHISQKAQIYAFDGRLQHPTSEDSKYSGQLPREVTVIRKMAPVNVIVYYPKTEEGKDELARRVADVHASTVTQRIKSLNCPERQKLELLDAVIETVSQRVVKKAAELS